MRTKLMITLIVSTILLAALAGLVAMVWWLGWSSGVVVAFGLAGAVVALYRWVIRPWHLRWGATDIEVARGMPGDDLIPDAQSATRAITINGAAEQIWPWLLQLGFGKAGWYSYDWIDNDFNPSADRVIPEHQDLKVGDKILMMETMGFVVHTIDMPRAIVSALEDGSTSWCLGLYPMEDGGTRLVSRWRPKFEMTPATFLMTALAEPGTFIMEQKMLRTIRDRVEAQVGSLR